MILSAETRQLLEARVRASTTSQRDAERAQIVLLAAAGTSTTEIASALGIRGRTASRWRGRFARSGLAGLKDRPRSGHPIRIGAVTRCEIIAVACEPAPKSPGLNGWTLDRMVSTLDERGIVKISRSHLHTILERVDLKPHRTRMWLHSPDPKFREKVAEIVALYLHKPPGSVVLSIDEKTGMQALARKHPGRPASPGCLAKKEFEYIRHGTQSLIAAFEVHTGEMTGVCGKTRTGADLESFMETIAAKYPTGIVHVIWDNLNIHHGERWRLFNARHGGRFVFHYTPLHASWVNQIELWFGILARRCLRHGSFESVEALRSAVLAFLDHWNSRDKKPFRWTFTGYPLQTGELNAAA